MRVIVEANVFRGDLDHAHHGDLLTLFRIGLRGHHTIEVEPRKDPRFVAWLESEGLRTRQMCERALDRGLKRETRRRRAHTLRVAYVDTASWVEMKVPVATALDFLRRPLVILLENERTDAHFLRTLTRLADGFDLGALEKETVVELRSRGGTENRMWLQDERRTREELLRLWVLSDSDARRTWRDPLGNCYRERLGALASELSSLCEKLGVPIHVLSRRSIENYLPLPVLDKWSEDDEHRRELYEAFASLSDEQRYHYNMKSGFAQDKKDPDHARKVGELYKGLPEPTDRSLAHGFNKRAVKIGELLKGTPIHIPNRWLVADKQEEEALQIVRSIREYL
ncbi:hypothetical protein [Polyangium sp. 6x1]|uniref:hypothetical protein n=1 Tax=Polyangium sp. 6x1 TaxID=3042689 RepID=UPI002482DCEE|nr:hypothetical protein [Polyangium sp. 6x1]MDI1450484.1 hypothetical protein [Polyangium sp. 6x1]